MVPQNKWKIPHQCGTREYCRCYYLCKKLGKPWPELTDDEKASVHQKGNTSVIPPAVKKVFDALSPTTPKTKQDIQRETGMYPRTIYYSLRQLKTRGLVMEKFNFADARQVLYQKKNTPPVDEATGEQGKAVS